MQTPPDQDKTGSALNAQRFRMLEDIARELAGEVVFPTCFDIAIKLRKALQDDDYTLEQITKILALEPLIPAKLLHLANSAYYNRGGRDVRDLHNAVSRLGLNTVRSTALAIAMNQLLRSRDMAEFGNMSARLWQHSLKSACAAQVVASRLTRINPEEAQLAGLMHDLGAFYMLYRATQYEELRARPQTVRFLVMQWHESIGHTLLLALGLPEDIAEAMRDHDQQRQVPMPPRTLGDVLYVANILAGGGFEWIDDAPGEAQAAIEELDPAYSALKDEIEARYAEIRAAFA